MWVCTKKNNIKQNEMKGSIKMYKPCVQHQGRRTQKDTSEKLCDGD